MAKIIDLDKVKNASGLLIPISETGTPGLEVSADLGIFLDEIEAELGLKVANINFYRKDNLIHSMNLNEKESKDD